MHCQLLVFHFNPSNLYLDFLKTTFLNICFLVTAYFWQVNIIIYFNCVICQWACFFSLLYLIYWGDQAIVNMPNHIKMFYFLFRFAVTFRQDLDLWSSLVLGSQWSSCFSFLSIGIKACSTVLAFCFLSDSTFSAYFVLLSEINWYLTEYITKLLLLLIKQCWESYHGPADAIKAFTNEL